MRPAHPFFVATILLLGLGVAFPLLAMGLPLPTAFGEMYGDLDDIVLPEKSNNLPSSAAGHQTTYESRAHIPVLWQDAWAGPPVFNAPQGASCAVTSHQYPTTLEYSEQSGSNDLSHLRSYSGTNETPYQHPLSGDVSGTDRQPLLSFQGLPEVEPTPEATWSPSSQATLGGNAQGDFSPQKVPRYRDRDGSIKTMNYFAGTKDPNQPNLPVPLGSIASIQVGSQMLEASALEEFKERMHKLYPRKPGMVNDLQYKPRPMIDPNTDRIDNGFTLNAMRERIHSVFRGKKVERRNQRQAARQTKPSLHPVDRLLQEIERPHSVDGYSIVFFRYRFYGPDGQLSFSILAQNLDNEQEKVWVGDVVLPKSLWLSEAPRRPRPKRSPRPRKAAGAP